MFGPQLSSHSSSARLNPLLEVLIAVPRGGKGSMRIQKGNLWFSSLHEIFSPSKIGPGFACKCPKRPHKKIEALCKIWSALDLQYEYRLTARVFLSSPLLQLERCWITWKTWQVLRNNQSFFDRSHFPTRKDLSWLSTIHWPIQQMIITIPLSWFSHKHEYHIPQLPVISVCSGRSPNLG